MPSTSRTIWVAGGPEDERAGERATELLHQEFRDDPEELREFETASEELTAAVRRLIDLTVRTEVGPEELRSVASSVDDLSARLSVQATDEPLGLHWGSDGKVRGPANAAAGRRNPIAPPVRFTTEPDQVRATATLGAAYEGPPGHVHGGVIGLVLDQVLGATAAILATPGLTAYLNLTYRRPTRLGEVAARGWVVETNDWKTLVRAELFDARDRLTAEAEGLFVVPSWARSSPPSPPQSDSAEYQRPEWFTPGRGA